MCSSDLIEGVPVPPRPPLPPLTPDMIPPLHPVPANNAPSGTAPVEKQGGGELELDED